MLHRFRIDDHFGNLKKLTAVGKRRFGPRFANHFERLGHDVVSRLVIGAEAFIRSAVRMTAAGGEIHPAVADQIEHRRFFGKLHRMVHRQCVDGDTEAQTFGSLRHRTKHNVRSGEQRKFRLAMNLCNPVGVESQAIGQLGLFHEFFEPRRR